jgi:hypothetical protein
MKNILLVLFLFTAFAAFSQKKKKVDPKDAQIDTLTRANTVLTAQLDSVSKNYNGLYTTVKEKLVKSDFDPADLSGMIDSVYASRDSVAALQGLPLKDSVQLLHQENAKLKVQIDTMNHALQKHTTANFDKAKLMTELKDLKSLLDAKVITQAEFDDKKKIIMDKWQ